MKFLKFAVAAVFAATFGNAYAFHSGGVAECEGCHSMHNSFEGSTNVTGRTFAQGTGIYLLKATVLTDADGVSKSSNFAVPLIVGVDAPAAPGG